jgi:NADPH:quinone reductase-like Zn-dependent oxidoreductase
MKARAWRFRHPGGPEVLELTEEEVGPPGPGQALVRVRAVGLNRSELMHLAGRYFGPPPSPSYLGQEAVGEVVDLGDIEAGSAGLSPRPLKAGSRVGLLVGRVDFAGMGSYRTVGCYPADALLPVPDSFTNAEGAAFWLAALTAAGGLWTGGLRPDSPPGRRVLITAASSGIGAMALKIARAWGAHTLAATTSAEKREALEALADEVIVVGSPEELAAGAKEGTGGRGVDVAFDPVGFSYAQALFDAAAQDGHVIYYGLLAGKAAALDLRTMILKDLAVHGYTVYRLQRRPELLREIVARLHRLPAAAAARAAAGDRRAASRPGRRGSDHAPGGGGVSLRQGARCSRRHGPESTPGEDRPQCRLRPGAPGAVHQEKEKQCSRVPITR